MRDAGSFNPEQKGAIASDIYSTLQRQRGFTSLTGPGSGEVIRADMGRRIKVAWHNVDTEYRDYNRMLLHKKGFEDPDIDAGVLLMTEAQFKNPNWPETTFITPEPHVATFNVSGTGKILRRNGETFEPSTLETHHLDALARLATLSVVPRQIIQTFGSYENFTALLGEVDMAGIEFPEKKPYRALYDGGLSKFVKELEVSEETETGENRLSQLWQTLSRRQ